jgi:heat shock protein HslJ
LQVCNATSRAWETVLLFRVACSRVRESTLQTDFVSSRARESTLQTDFVSSRVREMTLQGRNAVSRAREMTLQVYKTTSRGRAMTLQVYKAVSRAREATLQAGGRAGKRWRGEMSCLVAGRSRGKSSARRREAGKMACYLHVSRATIPYITMNEHAMKRFLLFSLTCLSLLACEERPHAPFHGTRWVVEHMGFPEMKAKPGPREVSIVFNDTTRVASGKAGCNTYLATYREEGQQGLSVSNLQATRVTCPDMYLEAIFFKVLKEMNNYTFRRGKLRLRKDDEELAVLRPGHVE